MKWNCLNCKKEFDSITRYKKNNEFCSDGCGKEFYEKRAEILNEPINEKKFKQILIRHKKDIYFLSTIKQRLFGEPTDKYNDLFIRIKRQGKTLCIVSARYKCEECGEEENLTIHHLVTRMWKKIMRDFSKYLTSRYYWTNQILLCLSCHGKKHFGDVSKEVREEMEGIDKDYIIKLKERFKPDENNLSLL